MALQDALNGIRVKSMAANLAWHITIEDVFIKALRGAVSQRCSFEIDQYLFTSLARRRGCKCWQ